MDKKKFWIQMLIFLTSSLLIPIIYLSIRFKLFTQHTTITVWALIVAIIIICIVAVMIKYWLAGMKAKFSFLKQLAMGFVKVVLPITCILLITIAFKNKLDYIVENIDVFIEAMAVILACECVAIVVNPLPKWAFDNNVEGMGEILNKILSKKEGEAE